MNIIFFCRSFDQMAGGVERAAITLMNEMSARGHAVHVITWDHPNARAFYQISPAITWHKIYTSDSRYRAGLWSRIRRMVAVRKIVQKIKPDIGVGFQHGAFLAASLFCTGLRVPMICAERNSPTRMAFTPEGQRRFLVFQTMRLACAVTIQIEKYRVYYPSYLHSKIRSISNPVVMPSAMVDVKTPNQNNRFALLSVGRLSFQKNYLVLIAAFHKIYKNFPNWDLVIAGEGEDRSLLESKIKEYGLLDRVHLLGAVQDVEKLYQSAHLFVLPSRWEGFPNALAEAMAHGLPAIGFDQCDGVNALIQDKKNGLLVSGSDDANCLSDGLSCMMGDANRRQEYGAAAQESMIEFVPQKIFDQWEDLFLHYKNKQ